MRIFITGASGFIGRHLLPLLDRHELLCLSHNASIATQSANISTIPGNLDSPPSYAVKLAQFQPDCCIHLAWSGLPDYSFGTCRDNLLAGIDLFETLERIGCRKLFVAGSCWEYGHRNGPVKEEDQNNVPSLFAAFKNALHMIGQSSSIATATQFIWGRIFFAYGAGQRNSSLIPSCYHTLMQGVAPNINNPLARNDFIHVSDVAAAIHTLIETDTSTGIYNIGSGQPAAVWEVVNRIAQQIGHPPVYSDMPVPSASSGFWADTDKMHLLGWKPRFSLATGIAKTIADLEKNR
jgi:UDP-glucose 4-epimerase